MYVKKGWHETRFCYFSENFNFCLKKSAAKFLRVKTSSGKVVATSFLYLTYFGRRLHLPEICAQSDPPPVGKRRFRHISLNSAAAMRDSEKISTNKKSNTRAIDEPCTLPLSPPTGGTKRGPQMACGRHPYLTTSSSISCR